MFERVSQQGRQNTVLINLSFVLSPRTLHPMAEVAAVEVTNLSAVAPSDDPSKPAPSDPSNTPAPLLPPETGAQIAARCSSMIQGAISSLCVYLGHELGLYKTLKDSGPCSAQQLAAAAGLSERWVTEWLYQQSASRLVCCDSEAKRFWMTEAQVEVLVEPESFADARESPLEMVLKMPVVLAKHERLLDSFRTGQGLSFDETGIDHCEMHRHARAVQLEQRLRKLPGLVEKLQQGVKVADVGCGSGEVVMHLASLFPNSTFVGYDISKRALSSANQRKAARGITNATFLNPEDGPDSQLPGKPTFHMIVSWDVIHDLTKPQEMLQIIWQSLLEDDSRPSAGTQAPAPAPAPAAAAAAATDSQASPVQPQQQQDAISSYSGGPVFLVTDIKSTGAPHTNIATMPNAPFLYGVSIGICMSSATSEPGGAGLGTVGWHEDVARKMSAEAGFSRFTKFEEETVNGFNWHAHYMMTP